MPHVTLQRSLLLLLLRVILVYTLAKISDDAGAFILRSLVSPSQRRGQLSSAAGEHRVIGPIVADARRQKYEPGCSDAAIVRVRGSEEAWDATGPAKTRTWLRNGVNPVKTKRLW